ncbi:MAG: hypothetical protein IH585_04865 [Anaerolineaceae bacterium]|nr:hypothetical protein [Anaerolineaceae bacterium]
MLISFLLTQRQDHERVLCVCLNPFVVPEFVEFPEFCSGGALMILGVVPAQRGQRAIHWFRSCLRNPVEWFV